MNLQYAVVTFLALAAVLGGSAGRDLRPADHGLTYSSPPAQNDDVQQMRSFFGSSVQLPEAKNISDTWISAHADGNGVARDVGKDHVTVRTWLLVASAVCGLTGVVLLAISGVVFVYRLQKKKKQKAAATSALISPPAINKNSG